MEWERKEREAKPKESRAEVGQIYLSVTVQEEGRRWKYFDLHFGLFSDDSIEQCEREWPREALRLARLQLDQLARELGADDTETG